MKTLHVKTTKKQIQCAVRSAFGVNNKEMNKVLCETRTTKIMIVKIIMVIIITIRMRKNSIEKGPRRVGNTFH